MNARIKTDNVETHPLQRSDRTMMGQKERMSPVLKHMDRLQGQLQKQLDSVNAMVGSMQRISGILDRMAKKRCRLNDLRSIR